MTTVILTPTHMACDHNFIDQTFPRLSKTNLSGKKIFVDPQKRFMIGISGNYVEADVDHADTYDAIGKIVSELVKVQMMTRMNMGTSIEHKESNDHLVKTFGLEGSILIATKRRRFILFYYEKNKLWAAKKCGEFTGIGTGGSYAVGLLSGGMALKDIWKPLNQIDSHTSQEHTILPLSILKLWSVAV